MPQQNFRSMLRSSANALVFVWGTRLHLSLSGFIAFLFAFDFRLPADLPRLFRLCASDLDCGQKRDIQASNLNRWGLRYVTIADVHRIVMQTAPGRCSAGRSLITLPPRFPRSILLIDLIPSLLGTAGLRVVIRMVAEPYMAGGNWPGEEKR